MKIILCSAVRKEIWKIIRHFDAELLFSIKNKYHIYYHNNEKSEIFFIIAGVGHKNIKKNLDCFIKKYNLNMKFLWILTGYAGSLTDNLKISEIVIPGLVRNEKKIYELHANKYMQLRRNTVLFEVPRIYGEQEKRDLKIKYPDIDIIDMESSSFCEVMEDNSFRNFFVYKSVTDNLTFKFPDPRLIKDSVFKIKFRDFSVLLKDISQLKYLIAIYMNMSRASKSIYNFFIKFYNNYSGM